MREEMASEYRNNRFCSTDGLCSKLRVSPIRRALQRRLQGKDVFPPGSNPPYGRRATSIPEQSQERQGLSARGEPTSAIGASDVPLQPIGGRSRRWLKVPSIAPGSFCDTGTCRAEDAIEKEPEVTKKAQRIFRKAICENYPITPLS